MVSGRGAAGLWRRCTGLVCGFGCSTMWWAHGASSGCTGRLSKEGSRMRCPYCRHPDSRVVDSREADDGQLIRRRRACQECGRRFTTVEEAVLAVVAQRVEETIRARGSAEVPSHEVGLAILGPLRELDEVAYLRFASVYRSFESLEDFEREIDSLRTNKARVTVH